MGMGRLDDSGSNSETGHGAEEPWKVPSSVLNPHSTVGLCGENYYAIAQMRKWTVTVVSQGMAKDPECRPQARPVTLPWVLGTGGLVLPSGWDTSDQF